MHTLTAFLCGLLFAIGLGVSGMTSPAKVLGFLNIAGDWDPSLGFVMAGALAVTVPCFPRIVARGRPMLEDAFELPTDSAVDRPLLFGALLFGIGWGLAGYCPGPAITALASGSLPVVLFVAAMYAGFALPRK